MNFKYYKELGYNVENSKEFFEVNVEHLTKGCHVKVDVSCDYYGKKLSVIYKNYLKYTEICKNILVQI
jgi:hypothetical protein